MTAKSKEIRFDNFIWIDICNPDLQNLESIAAEHELDYFQIRDSLQVGHLPKLEVQDRYNFLILRALTSDFKHRPSNIRELSNKIAFFYNEKRIITIHRSDFAFLENINHHFTHSEELLLFLINKMLETYIEPTKLLIDKNDILETSIFLKKSAKISLEDIYYQKTQARITKSLLQFTQNVINHIEVRSKSKTALQDIKDTLLSLLLNYDDLLENSNNLLNTHISLNSQKSNDVMKLLTIFSAFFLPLSFIAGLYGMNFQHMPELSWPLGYYYALSLMVGVAITIFIWFKRRRIL